jgi:hypothetical protein
MAASVRVLVELGNTLLGTKHANVKSYVRILDVVVVNFSYVRQVSQAGGPDHH